MRNWVIIEDNPNRAALLADVIKEEFVNDNVLWIYAYRPQKLRNEEENSLYSRIHEREINRFKQRESINHFIQAITLEDIQDVLDKVQGPAICFLDIELQGINEGDKKGLNEKNGTKLRKVVESFIENKPNRIVFIISTTTSAQRMAFKEDLQWKVGAGDYHIQSLERPEFELAVSDAHKFWISLFKQE